MTGYLHPAYAQSLAEFGTPRELPESGGWILERPIPGTPHHDAMGCYPLFTCRDWSKLHCDLEYIKNDLVSLALVTDPFGGYDERYLHQCFKDVVLPFKEHFIVDLSRPISNIVSKHHRYYAQKSFKKIQVEKYDNPTQFLDEWINLYANLIQIKNLKGIKAFSKISFAKQLNIPGIVVFRALSQGMTVGAHLWYVQGEISYSHLASFSPPGYDLMASYALYWFAIEYFAHTGRWLDLGGGAGATCHSKDGLSQFKKGWATGTRTAYFCGRIFDQDKYSEIAKAKNISATSYFPAYRKDEFEQTGS